MSWISGRSEKRTGRIVSWFIIINAKVTWFKSCKNMVNIIALMLVLVKCYDNKMVKVTPHLFHPFVDYALGS